MTEINIYKIKSGRDAENWTLTHSWFNYKLELSLWKIVPISDNAEHSPLSDPAFLS